MMRIRKIRLAVLDSRSDGTSGDDDRNIDYRFRKHLLFHSLNDDVQSMANDAMHRPNSAVPPSTLIISRLILILNSLVRSHEFSPDKKSSCQILIGAG